MNEERFTELLNGYIDCELSEAEARELELEIADRPDRRATYEQYCRINQACQLVMKPRRAAIPQPPLRAIVAAARRPENEIEFPTPAVRRPAWAGFKLFTGGLITAGLALMISLNLRSPSGEAMAVNPANASTAPAAASEQTASAYRTILTLDAFAMSQEAGREATMLTPAKDPFEWMRQVEFEPIERIDVNTLVFSNDQPIHVPNGMYAPYPGLDDSPPPSEMTAFQFQR